MTKYELLRKAVKARKKYPERSFNCWGFTAYLMGWIKTPRWLNECEIERLIQDHCNLDGFGEILIFRYGEERPWIVHTAILLDNDTVLHKDGELEIRIDPLWDVQTWHYGMYRNYEAATAVQ
jgi:hypothetical protein